MKIDWSIDKNRETLRDSVRGKEVDIAQLFDADGDLMIEFYQQVGIGQYSHCRFVDFLIEEYPAQLAQAMQREG